MHNHRARWAFVLLTLHLANPSTQAAAPRLEVPLLADGVATIRLSGAAGESFRVEASTNLLSWTSIGSGVAQGGTLLVQHVLPAGGRATFYRGVAQSGAKPFPSVSPATDPSASSAALVSPADGGWVSLTLRNGVIISAQFPTNALLEDNLVRLTAVTNLTGLPTAQGLLAGAVLEPVGQVLSAPVLLEFQFPKNIPASRISSFAFRGSNPRLHLVPDLVSSNRVRIFMDQLGGFGCGVFTLDELDALAATASPPRTLRSAIRPHATLEECFPDDVKEAEALNQELTDKIAPLQQEAARILGRARQEQLLGVEDVGNPELATIMDYGQDFYDRELAPRAPAAAKKCAVAKELLPWMLGWERQRQLLGVASDDEPMDPRITDLMCNGLANCDRQIMDCCQRLGGDSRLVAQLLGNERQRQLLGLSEGAGCGGISVDDVVSECAPEWWGELFIKESGTYATNRTDGNAIDTEFETWQYELKAYVVTMKETITPGFPLFGIPGSTNRAFLLAGAATGAHQVDRHYKDLWDPCGGFSAARLASIRPHDGGSSLETWTRIHSEMAGRSEFELNVDLVASGGLFGQESSLRFINTGTNAPLKGEIGSIEKIITGAGCDEETKTGPPNETDLYGGQSFNAAPSTFQATAESIKFHYETVINRGRVNVKQTVILDLKKRK